MDLNRKARYTEEELATLSDEEREKLGSLTQLNRTERRKANREKGLRSNGTPK